MGRASAWRLPQVSYSYRIVNCCAIQGPFDSDVNIPREERRAAYSALEVRGRPMNEPSNAVSS
jgi:hypothetical protein